MTRDEQMWEAVEQAHGNLSRREAFVTLTALDWADKTMIEKACEWIIENMPHYVSKDYTYEVDMADDFRKAMEE